MLGNGAQGKADEAFRGYQGTLASGQLHVGNEVRVLPAGHLARVSRVTIAGRALRTANAEFDALSYRVDVNTLTHHDTPETAQMNDILLVTLKLQQPLLIDRYVDNRTTGSVIVIDPVSLNTVAAGVIVE